MWITILFLVIVFFVMRAIARSSLIVKGRRRYLEGAIDNAGFPAHETLIDQDGRCAIATNAVGSRCFVARFREGQRADTWTFDARDILGVAILENHITLHEYQHGKREVHGEDRKIQPIRDPAYTAAFELMKKFGFAEGALQKSLNIDRLQLAIAIERSHDAPFSDPLIFELVRTENTHRVVQRGNRAHVVALNTARHWMRLLVRSIELAAAEGGRRERSEKENIDTSRAQSTDDDRSAARGPSTPTNEVRTALLAQMTAAAATHPAVTAPPEPSRGGDTAAQPVAYDPSSMRAPSLRTATPSADAASEITTRTVATDADTTHPHIARDETQVADISNEDAWAKQRAKAFGLED